MGTARDERVAFLAGLLTGVAVLLVVELLCVLWVAGRVARWIDGA